MAADDDRSGRSVFPGFADVTSDMGELIDLLAARRRAQRLSQSEVAGRMGTSQPAVARLEAGRGDVRLSTLRRYADALGQTVEFALVTPPDPSDAP